MKNLIMFMMVVAVGISYSTSSAELLVNGSFELEDQEGGWLKYTPPPAWTVEDMGSQYYGYGTHGGITAQDGDQIASIRDTLFWQNTGIVLTEGYTYDLSSYAVSYDLGTQFALALYGATSSDASSREDYLGQGQFSPRAESLGFDTTPYLYSYTCDAANAGKYLQVAVYGWGGANYSFDSVELSIQESGLLEGDANRDGVVSAGDYASVQANFGNTGDVGILGDANLDGVVSAGDYASVQANFGNTSGSGAGVVPEPVTLSMLALSGIVMFKRRKN